MDGCGRGQTEFLTDFGNAGSVAASGDVTFDEFVNFHLSLS